MHIAALLVVALVFWPSAAVPKPLDSWTCSGPVNDCTAPEHNGSFGCAYTAGVGDSEAHARDAAKQDCEDQLHTTHGGTFTCKGLSQLDCHTP